MEVNNCGKPLIAKKHWIAAITDALSSPDFRELLLWCLPAIVLGSLARLALTIHFPYGYFHPDTPDYLYTAERFLKDYALVLHAKKSFLAPILFTLPFLLKIPALIIIPLAQHFLGLALTLASGALIRHWFRYWKCFIIPATVLITLNPALLWYEHALLAESHYLFCVMALALAGTVFAAQPSRKNFIWLLVVMFFTAGSRSEGKLFVVFVILVVCLAYWNMGRLWARNMCVATVVCALIWIASRNDQAGLLLYATVLPLAPDVSKVAPDFSPYINPLRDTYRERGETIREDLVNAEKTISKIVEDYFKAKGIHGSVGDFCQKLSIEAVRQKPFELPLIAGNKFLQSLFRPTSGDFTEYWVQGLQMDAYRRKDWMMHLMKGLSGRELRNDDDVAAFVKEVYPPSNPGWFTKLEHAWDALTLGTRVTPDRIYPKAKVAGLPLFFVIAGLGMLASLVHSAKLWKFHVTWLLTFCGVWVMVLLTGVVNPRYRFVFEPFCVIYALLFFDAVACGLLALFGAGRSKITAPSLPSQVYPS